MSTNTEQDNPQTIELGRKLYSTHCFSCHGPELKGGGPAAGALDTRPPDLTRLAQEKTAKSFAANITYGKGEQMPAYKEALTESQIWHLANYIASFRRTPK